MNRRTFFGLSIAGLFAPMLEKLGLGTKNKTAVCESGVLVPPVYNESCQALADAMKRVRFAPVEETRPWREWAAEVKPVPDEEFYAALRRAMRVTYPPGDPRNGPPRRMWIPLTRVV